MLQIKNICKKYITGGLTQQALNNVTFNLRNSEFVAILGQSGSGKTTLLNIIGDLDRYDSGDIVINSVSTKKYSNRDWDSYRNHDEPTGALDSETSVQVMELLKEVAKDRLVVMVTHNPELAEEYASRIIKLHDGRIVSDTNPYEVDETRLEPPEHKNMGKASMSISTALSLSFNNLKTKKGLLGVGLTCLLLIPIKSVIHAVLDTTAVNAALPVTSGLVLIILSMALTLIAGLIPAKKAAGKDPVIALRSE